MLRFKLHHLFAFSLLVTALCSRPAKAVGVNFDLVTATTTLLPSTNDRISPDRPNDNSQESEHQDFEPLPIPAAASQPPTRITQHTRLPSNVMAAARVLTPPPVAALPTTRVLTPQSPPADPPLSNDSDPIALSFAPKAAPPAAQPLASTQQQPALPQWIYQGGTDSLVARVIGSAEGTRTANGQLTRAYYGHTDPGNGIWNMGTFSYQHGASSPSEADQKQLKRLKRQGKTIALQADQANLALTLGETLNALDLANQSPRAALEEGGYIDRLAQARQKGMEHRDAIIWARTYAYLDPHTQRWNAPGLGNTLVSIKRDQTRRHQAIDRAFNHFQAHQYTSDGPFAKTLTTPIANLAQPDTVQVSVSKPAQDLDGKTVPATQPTPLAFGITDVFSPESNVNKRPHKVSSDIDVSHRIPHPSQAASQASAISAPNGGLIRG